MAHRYRTSGPDSDNYFSLLPADAVGGPTTSARRSPIGVSVYYRLPTRTLAVLGVLPLSLQTHSLAVAFTTCGICYLVEELSNLIFTARYASEVRHALGAVARTALLPAYGAGKAIRVALRSPPQYGQHGKSAFSLGIIGSLVIVLHP